MLICINIAMYELIVFLFITLKSKEEFGSFTMLHKINATVRNISFCLISVDGFWKSCVPSGFI